MIHIAICDDDVSDAERIEEQILRLQPLFSQKLETDVFYSGERFCKAIESHCPFDIVLMDIEMDGIDGIMAGQHLRAGDENDMVLLVYISSHESYYRQLFDAQPFAFLDKPIHRQEFSDTLEKAVSKTLRRRREGKRKILPVSQNGREVLLPFQKILYLESKVRKIRLFTTEGVMEYYSTLDAEAQKLAAGQFARTHQSFIVNFRFVKEFTSETLILTDKTEIPVSNSRRSAVKAAYMEYRRNCLEWDTD